MLDKEVSHVPQPARSELTRLLAVLDEADIAAVAIFGSTARGEDTDASDLDILLVVKDRSSSDTLLAEIHNGAAISFSPLVFTIEDVLDEASRRPSFIAHVLDEGLPVYASQAWSDPLAELRRRAADPALLEREVRNRVDAVEIFRHAERFGASPTTALSHLYSIGRSVVIARLLQQGIHEYSWQRAFDRFAELHPELRDDVIALRDLRPYYEYARARRGARLPEERVDVDEMRRVVASVRHVAG